MTLKAHLHGWRRLWFLGVAAAIASVVVAAVASAQTGAAKPTLTVAGSAYCSSASPVAGGFDTQTSGTAYETLIWFNADGKFVPGLATSWSVKPGNKAITLTLRSNARFSDGVPVTAQAVKTWIEWRDKQTPPLQQVGPIRSIEVLSKYVLRMNLKTPNPFLVQSLSQNPYIFGPGQVASPRVVAEMKANPKSTLLNRQTFGAGPYVLVPGASVFGDHCTYVPNKYYYDKSKIKWSKVIFKVIANENTMLAALRAGQVDVGDGYPNSAAAATAAGFRVVQAKPYSVFLGASFFDRTGKLFPALADVRVRQALNYAINRKLIATALFGKYASPSSTPFPGAPGNDAKLVNYYPYDPAKARALLAAAGYPNGFTFKIANLVYDLLKLRELAQAIRRDLQAIGVNVELLVPVDNNEYVQTHLSKTLSAGVHLYYSANPSPFVQWGERLAPGGFWFDQHGWRDPVLDRLYLRALRANPRNVVALERQVIARCVAQAYFLPVLRHGTSLFVSKRVSGVKRPSEFAFQVVDWSRLSSRTRGSKRGTRDESE